MRWIIGLAFLALVACDVSTAPPQSGPQPQMGEGLTPAQAAMAFQQVVARVEPVAERECRRHTRRVNCDFAIYVDRDPHAPANAFQSLSDSGRPEITFTIALIADIQNADELAFVMSHEAAHHIQGHLQRQSQNAAAGAEIFAGLATIRGVSPADVEAATELGAFVGARSYSKEFELEADAMGTVITYRAGFDPLRGAQYFARLPDPGNQFLGTHPSNSQRFQVVQQTVQRIEG
ncbi:MAG: M48 family metalloprotease [Rhodobacteraceae bacterium]|nr:M48 family metalloprotease [Paracoccaceae bacterium]